MRDMQAVEKLGRMGPGLPEKFHRNPEKTFIQIFWKIFSYFSMSRSSIEKKDRLQLIFFLKLFESLKVLKKPKSENAMRILENILS
jgi:hypothetical protein